MQRGSRGITLGMEPLSLASQMCAVGVRLWPGKIVHQVGLGQLISYLRAEM